MMMLVDRKYRGIGLIAGAAVTLLALGDVARAQKIPSDPGEYVVDLAGVIDSGVRSKLNRYLGALDRACGAQLKVLTVRDTGGAGVEDMAVRVFESWKLGDEKKKNGLLFLISVEERRWKFEVGYGLEGFLTDSVTGRVGRDICAPHFKQGDFGAGVWEGGVGARQCDCR